MNASEHQAAVDRLVLIRQRLQARLERNRRLLVVAVHDQTVAAAAEHRGSA